MTRKAPRLSIRGVSTGLLCSCLDLFALLLSAGACGVVCNSTMISMLRLSCWCIVESKSFTGLSKLGMFYANEFANSPVCDCVACRGLQQYSRPLSLTMRICIPTWASLATWAWCKSKGKCQTAHVKVTVKPCRLTQLPSACCACLVAAAVHISPQQAPILFSLNVITCTSCNMCTCLALGCLHVEASATTLISICSVLLWANCTS